MPTLSTTEQNSIKSQPAGKWRHVATFLFISLLTLLVYKDLPKSEFYLDDYLHLHLIQAFSHPFEPFFVDVFMGAFFRPAITLFWSLDNAIYDLWAGGYYISNIVYLLASILLLYALMLNLTGSRRLSGLTSLLYALGPVTGVGVMWLSNRFDLIGTMLFLASTLLFIRYVRYRQKANYILSIALATLAYFCKEITITLPVILVLAAGFMFLYRSPQNFNGRLIKRLLSLTTPYFTVAAAYIIWRFIIIKSLGGYVGETKEPFSLGYLFFIWHNFAEYFWMGKSFIGFGVLLIAIAMLLAKKDFYANNKVFFFGLLFAVITALPLVLIIRYQSVMSYMTPRFFFLPNIGMIIALASIYDPRSGKGRRVVSVVLLSLITVFFMLNTYIMVHKWSRDKQKVVDKMEKVHEYVNSGLPGDPDNALIYSCLHGMDVALDAGMKLRHPEYKDRYFFMNCTGPTQTIAERPLYMQMRRHLTYPQTFSRNPCDYEDLVYGVVDTDPKKIPSQVGTMDNVMVLHLDRQGKMTVLHRDKVVGILRTLGILP